MTIRSFEPKAFPNNQTVAFSPKYNNNYFKAILRDMRNYRPYYAGTAKFSKKFIIF